MKRIILIAALVALATACKRQYKCVCVNNGIEAPNVYLERFSKTEADAEKVKCETDSTCTFKQGN
ncbi:MAG: hypothetical protein MUF42_01035 [Cytophagaceae bacterium]|jgi:hypothetical protein|nr:hypothetical protein [Cytophagaceae bacterium]